MKIYKIAFNNYTNLSSVELCFDLNCNFFVGENSIGKSNALRCIEHIYLGTPFAEKDFYNKKEPIIINAEFYTKEKYTNEKGKKINVKIMQYCNQELQYFSNDIFIEDLKKELKVLYLQNSAELENFTLPKNEFSNDYIKLFNSLAIVKRAKRHIGLKEDINLNNITDNLSYSKFFVLDILLKILKSLESAKQENYQGIIIYSCPEQNLHPFAQKTLVKDLLDLASGQDLGFNRFIEQHFGIKSISLQLFFKSYSDRVLPSDYTKIVRFYRENKKVNAVCGSNVYKKLRGDYHIQKQLEMQFPYFSLAIFSKCVILIEGLSEYGAMQEFAKKLDIDLDYLGISIISANGEGNIPAFAKLLRNFKIKVFTIRDKDNLNKFSSGDDFYTDRVDFEDEIVASVSKTDMLKILESSGIEYKKIEFSAQTLQRRNLRYLVTNKKISQNLSFKDYNKSLTNSTLFNLCLLYSNKSILTGKCIGEVISCEQIPGVYKKVLMLAKDYSLNN